MVRAAQPRRGVRRFVDALGLAQRWLPSTGWQDTPQMLHYVILPTDPSEVVEVTQAQAYPALHPTGESLPAGQLFAARRRTIMRLPSPQR